MPLASKNERYESLRRKASEILNLGLEPDIEKLSKEDVIKLIHELQVHQIELDLQNEELRGSQKELEISRDRYFKLFNISPVGYLVLDHSGMIHQVNSTFQELIGYDLSNIVNRPLVNFVCREDYNVFLSEFGNLVGNHRDKNFQVSLTHRNGNKVHVNLECKFTDISLGFFSSNSTGDRFLVCINDISKQHKYQETLHDIEQEFRRMSKSSDMVFLFKEQDRFIFANDAFEVLWEHKIEELYESADVFFKPIEFTDQKVLKKLFNEPNSSHLNPMDFEFKLHNIVKGERWIHLKILPIPTREQKPHRIACIAQDITEKKNLLDLFQIEEG